jgi:hypothetical protein
VTKQVRDQAGPLPSRGGGGDLRSFDRYTFAGDGYEEQLRRNDHGGEYDGADGVVELRPWAVECLRYAKGSKET